jgi:HD-GYP domain-containing protein (c-di-GMP phosphodiesterase class II)
VFEGSKTCPHCGAESNDHQRIIQIMARTSIADLLQILRSEDCTNPKYIDATLEQMSKIEVENLKDEDFEEIVSVLRDKTFILKRHAFAIERLLRQNEEAMASFIRGHICHPDWTKRKEIADFLCEIGLKGAYIKPLFERLTNEAQTDVKLSILKALSTSTSLTKRQLVRLVSLLETEKEGLLHIAVAINRNKERVGEMNHGELAGLCRFLHSHSVRGEDDVAMLINIAEALSEEKRTPGVMRQFKEEIRRLNRKRTARKQDENVRLWNLFGMSCFFPPLLRALLKEALIPVDVEGIIKELMASVQERDGYRSAHCERVANYAMILARKGQKELRLSNEDLSLIVKGASVHDVGMVYMPDTILLSKAELEKEQRKQIDTHAPLGAALLDRVQKHTGFPINKKVKEMVRCHHEKMDGSGPLGMKENKIPLCAEIICVSDIFDALTNKRPYREPKTPEQAADAIVRMGDDGKFRRNVISIFRKAAKSLFATQQKYMARAASQ